MFMFSDIETYLQKIVRKDVRNVVTDIDMECNGSGEKAFRRLIQYGYGALMNSKEYGGNGFSAEKAMIVLNEIAKENAGLAHIVATHNFGYLYLIEMLGTKEQKEKYIIETCKEGKYGSLGYNEPTAQIQTTARCEGDYYYINGMKSMITEANHADYMLVYAVGENVASGSMFIIDLKNTEGITVGKNDETMGFHSLDICDVIFENVKVHKSQLLFAENKGLMCIVKSMELMRLTNAVISQGIAQRAFEETVKQTKKYETQSGKLCDMQFIQYTLADIKACLERMELLVFYTASIYDADYSDKIFYSSVSKLLSTEEAKKICDECLQVFGAYGYVKGYIVEQLYRDVRVLSIIGGTREMMKNSIARKIYEK